MIIEKDRGESSKSRAANLAPPQQSFTMHSSHANVIHVESSLDPNEHTVIRIDTNAQADKII